MALESKENYPWHTKIVQNSLGFMPEVKPLHKPRGDLVLCALVIPLRQVALAQLYKYHHQSGNAASGKLVWNQHNTGTATGMLDLTHLHELS